MTSLEWIELENLSREIGEAQLRLQAAEVVDSFDVARTLEREIAEMEKRRGGLLAHIASHVVGEQRSTGASSAGEPGDLLRLAPPVPDTSGDVEPSTERDQKEGAEAMWKQLTPDDVERAKQELIQQRAETLARYAEELKSLDAQDAEVAALEQAISTFIKKFWKEDAEIVALDPSRHSRA